MAHKMVVSIIAIFTICGIAISFLAINGDRY